MSVCLSLWILGTLCQGQELFTCFGVFSEWPQHGTGDCAAVHLLHAPHHHTHVSETQWQHSQTSGSCTNATPNMRDSEHRVDSHVKSIEISEILGPTPTLPRWPLPRRLVAGPQRSPWQFAWSGAPGLWRTENVINQWPWPSPENPFGDLERIEVILLLLYTYLEVFGCRSRQFCAEKAKALKKSQYSITSTLVVY